MPPNIYLVNFDEDGWDDIGIVWNIELINQIFFYRFTKWKIGKKWFKSLLDGYNHCCLGYMKILHSIVTLHIMETQVKL